jgi:hypothetical protein
LESLEDELRRRRVVAAALALYYEKYSRTAYERSVRSVLALVERGCQAPRSRLVFDYTASTASASPVARHDSAGAPSR